MRKFDLLFGIMVMIASLAFFPGCESDDASPEQEQVMKLIERGELKGVLTESYTLDAAVSYVLTGQFVVDGGATLTIPAGTQIIATASQGQETETYIAVMMGSKIRINGTANAPVVMTSPNAQPQDWGGLTICGKSTTSAGVNATAEVGNFKYGGTDNADNSGNINYLVIKGSGAKINTESEYNGLTLYAVGTATSISNVAIINGADDGIEFFGGTVSVQNLYLENNEDDAIDWTEGWNGTVTNAYIKHTIEGFSTALEADGVNNNPRIVNLTAVSTTGGIALQFKKESGATITGLSLLGYDTILDMANDGPLANVIIEGESASMDNAYDAAPTVDPSSWTWAEASVVEVVELNGTQNGNVTLNPAKAYRLTGSYIVETGKLTIPAGTRILAVASQGQETETYIAVMMGAKIDILGTSAQPVIMTSPNGRPQDWGGLTICGKSVTTAGVNATAEVGNFKYGGTDVADNSGSINYLVIKGSGAKINTESEYNGLTLYAVGSGTIIRNIAVINGADDGVEFFGGTVSAENLYLENNEDDAIDWTEGWNGTVTNAYVKHTIDGFSTVVEADGVNNNPAIINLTAVNTHASAPVGIALQFKKQSGATMTNVYLEGYSTLVDMPNGGPLANVLIDGAVATLTGPYLQGKLNISSWTWFQ